METEGREDLEMTWGEQALNIKDTYAVSAQSVPSIEDEIRLCDKIPVFGDTTPENQEKLDKIVAGFSFHDPAAAQNFGRDNIRMHSEAAERELPNVNFSSLESSITNTAFYISKSNIEDLSYRTARLLKKGDSVVKPGIFKRIFSSAVGIVSEEKARKMSESDSVARLQYEINHTLLNFGPFIRDIQISALSFPKIKEKVEKLYQVNLEMLPSLSLYIAAGIEIEKRYREEILPEAEKRKRDDIIGYSDTLAAAQNFRHQMKILNMAHLSTMDRAMLMGIQAEIIADTIDAVDYILTYESGLFKANLGANHRMLETLDMMNIQEARLGDTREKTVAAIKEAERRAKTLDDENQTPEQIGETMEFLRATREKIHEMAEKLPEIERVKAAIAERLNQSAREILNVRVECAGQALEFAKR